ncbi:multicomponent Na+:H+ antiporter subunit D [Clostridiales Family XIII bacterium PM5-7]
MIANLPILVVLCPLFGALFCPVASWINKRAGQAVVVLFMVAALVLSILQLREIVTTGELHYWFGNWQPPYGIEFALDSLSGVLVVLICAMGLLSVIYSMAFYKNESKFKSCGYFSIISMLVTGLIGMTSTGDVFNLYVFLEITALSGYGLIAIGGDKGVLSAFRYLLIGTVGASFYLLGVAFLYGETGTLNMADMAELIGPVINSGTTVVAMVFFIGGFGIKMALFPLHGWQPAAYSNAHPGAAPLIAGVMGKIPAYALLRFFYFVFNANQGLVGELMIVVGTMASFGMIYGCIKAMQQRDVRRMLAYSSISQMGYIGIGIAMGDLYGLVGAVMHIVAHSFMKGGLFFCIGAIKYKYGTTSLLKLGQIYKLMPKTSAVIVVCALSMVGIPPFAGFFSKWDLALGAATAHAYIYIAVLIVSSLLSAIYFFKLIEVIFMEEGVELTDHHPEDKRELPITMMSTIVICGVMVLALGLGNTWILRVLSSVIMGVT